MSHRTVLSAIAAIVTASVLSLAPSVAQAAPVPACGNIDFSGATSVMCNFQTSGGCTAACTPISCTASASAMCSGSATAMCTGSCTADCMGMCTANPGMVTCSGDCNTNCDASCSGQCSSMGNSSECMGQCMGSCTNQCDIDCKATPPMASCDAKCTASCNGSCNVQANFSCQATAEASCTGGCTTACSDPMGALFCDFGNGLGAQYIDIPADQLAGCAMVLETMFSININASVSTTCTGDECTTAVSAGGCALAGNPTSPAPAGALFAGLGLALANVVRRRRKA